MISTNIKFIIDRILGKYKKVSNEYLYYCPFCKFEKKPKLSLNYDNNVYKCWICNKSGKNILSLIKIFGSKEDLKECISFFNVNVNIEELFQEKEIHTIKENKCHLPSEYNFLGYCKNNKYIEYLKSRNISQEDIFTYKIGYCDFGEYKNRVIFPSFDQNGDVNFFVAQAVEETPYKWLYPRVHKSGIIINEYLIDWSKPLYLTEGYIDYIKLNNIVGNVIPLTGKTIVFDDFGYNKLIDKILENNIEIVNLCLDTDIEKGIIKNRSLELSKILLKYNISSNIIRPDPWKDFGEIPYDKSIILLNKKIKIESKLDLLENNFHTWSLNV